MTITISGVHMKVDDELTKYVNKKIGKLEHYLPRTARSSAQVEVRLKSVKSRHQPEQQSCEIVLTLPKDRIVVEETTVNAFAAVDIVENALRTHIAKYKQRHATGRLYHRLRIRLGRI